jgi:cell division septum initiation protein DivIVA
MDVHDRLDQLTETIRSAKAMPMSASCLVNRAEMLDVIGHLREELPANLDHADALLSEREAVLAAGRQEAELILEGARSEREQLIEQTDVLVTARARAAEVTLEAQAGSTRLLADADDYVDRKLAEFEVFLGQLASQVNNGRLRLTARREVDLAHFHGTTPGASQGLASGDGEGVEVAVGSGSSPDPAADDHQVPAASGVPVGAR